MRHDQIEWDRKYRRASFSSLPASIVKSHAHQAPAGRALDVACGNGRNACYLAHLGFAVDAVDISKEGLKRFVCRPDGIQRICADLDNFVIPRGRYSLIINIRYLNRRMWSALQGGLSAGGMLIFESYLKVPDSLNGGRHRSKHLLNPDELRQSFPALDVVDYLEHSSLEADVPPMKASLVAVRSVRVPGGNGNHIT